MKYNIFSTLTLILRHFFTDLDLDLSGFFRIGSGFLADPDPHSEKKADPDPGRKKPGSETLKITSLADIAGEGALFFRQFVPV